MRPDLRPLATAVLLLAAAFPAGAEEPATPAAAVPGRDEIQALIHRLGDADWTKREAAARRIEDLGDAAVPLLEAARADDDPEVRTRAEALFEQLAFEVELRPATLTVAPGAEIALRPVLRNRRREPVVVMEPIDGADVGWRVVRYEWSVTDAEGKPVPRGDLARCGNVNSLKREDFVDIPPGGTHELKEPSFLSSPGEFYDLTKPGTYRVTLTYSFDAGRKDGGLAGPPGEGVRELLGKALVVRKTSRPVTVVVAGGAQGG